MTDIWETHVGLSYGTDLGVTLAALFPERVDKVLIGKHQKTSG